MYCYYDSYGIVIVITCENFIMWIQNCWLYWLTEITYSGWKQQCKSKRERERERSIEILPVEIKSPFTHTTLCVYVSEKLSDIDLHTDMDISSWYKLFVFSCLKKLLFFFFNEINNFLSFVRLLFFANSIKTFFAEEKKKTRNSSLYILCLRATIEESMFVYGCKSK